MTVTAEPAIATDGAGHRYGDFWALRDCTICLPPGSITAIVGPNGAGKTTLLNMLIGLLPASAGQLHVHGAQPTIHITAHHQPGSHFWIIRTVESAIFVGLAALLVTAAIVAVHRRRPS